MASINEIKSIFIKRGVAQSNRFHANLSGMADKLPFVNDEDVRDLQKMVQKINLPGRQFNSFDYDLYRHTTTFPTGYSHEALSIDFVCTADLHPKRIFDDWINYIIDTKEYRLRYANEYKCDFIISQLNHKEEETYTMKIDDVFPKGIRGIQYSQEAGDVVEFSVEFAFNDLHFPGGDDSYPDSYSSRVPNNLS